MAVAADHWGMTVYFTACGATDTAARERLGECLSLFTEIMVSGEWLTKSEDLDGEAPSFLPGRL